MMFDQWVVFLHTSNLKATAYFYETVLGLALARDQGVCRIYKISASGYLGFCEHRPSANPQGVVATLVCDDVDGWHAKLEKQAEITQPPTHNTKYQIYHFFFKDPNGYLLEIQRFDEPLR